GVFGQCLERDSTQFAGTDQSNRPCLTWNPNPILFGDKDPFHYQPTAGYLPPQNSGQYYCTSEARKPTKVNLSFQHFRRYATLDGSEKLGKDPATYIDKLANECDGGVIGDCVGNDSRDKNEADVHFANQFDSATAPNYVGRMTRLDLDPIWVDKGRGGYRNVASKKTPYISIDRVMDYPSYELCDYSDKYTVPEERGTSPNALRLVDAGNGYRETFYRIHSPLLMKDLGYTPSAEALRTALSDSSISFFKITPSVNGDVGRLACGYNAEWAEGMPTVDYKDQASLQGGEAAWRANFNKNYSPFLSRANEVEIKNPQDNSYQLSDCVQEDLYPNGTESNNKAINRATLPTNYKDVYDGFYETIDVDNSGSADKLSDPKEITEFKDKQCAFKAWEVSYNKPQNGGFNAFNTDQSLSYIRRYPVTDEDNACKSSSSPWFSIRAVFQSPILEGATGPDGQWTFVGFWTSACAGKSGGDHRYMYMDVEVGTADVCRELAEVKSSATSQDAAFTDRVWKQAGYRDPATGVTYSETNAPFSSALNTGIAGIEPLFQNGGEQAGFSPLDPPTFLRSGLRTYYSSAQFPRDKYAFLSNMFARIYRVYRYHDKAVTINDSACLLGPLKGTNCTIEIGEQNNCSVDGICDAGSFTASDRSQTRVCNLGPQKGLSCSSTPQCQGLGFAATAGTQINKLKNDCILNTGWTDNGDGTYDPPANSGLPTPLTTSAASTEKAFVCNGIGNRNGGSDTYCSRPGLKTDDCAAIAPNTTNNNTNTIGATCVVISATNTNKACLYRSGNQAALDTLFSSSGVTVSKDNPSDTVPKYNDQYIACTTNRDCQVKKEDIEQSNQACAAVAANDSTFGRCIGGLQAGEVCNTKSLGDCKVLSYSDTDKVSFANSCGAVAGATECRSAFGDPNSSDPAQDNNVCTHPVGYYPRLDLCPDPSNEYCGLVSYRLDASGKQNSLDPESGFPLPTDVTLGHYTPTFLGLTGERAINRNFSYITYYTPRPPMVAAPDTRNCATPGQCEIAQTNAFNLSGQTAGPLNAGVGQFVASMRFYAWATHNQMPLKRIYIDWGDGQSTKLADTKLKNRKPYCNVQSECSDQVRASGLTCNSDGDCPAGAGLCKSTGVCQNQPQKTCSADAECGSAEYPNDRCIVRTMFGNSRDACDSNYFDFQHVYVCNDSMKPGGVNELPACQIAAGYCSRNPSRTCTADSGCAAGDTCIAERMASVTGVTDISGCFVTTTNSCYFTPRLQVMDNWGWCTGECRADATNGVLGDLSSSKILHPYGGCYAGANPDPEDFSDTGEIRLNTNLTRELLDLNE
ncbi:MAG: hypothetical protein KC585_03450, partial [Candidatus Magasanikbacteria bacterium]|nr:hypothetical protein [Candidatus Magasanikbacteria bacterium]